MRDDVAEVYAICGLFRAENGTGSVVVIVGFLDKPSVLDSSGCVAAVFNNGQGSPRRDHRASG